MNVLKVYRKRRGMFRDLHPSDPLWIVVASYSAAADFMENDVPDTLEVISAMYDLLDESSEVGKLTLMQIEAMLRNNGFDFINKKKVRENSSQNYMGGGIIGLSG